VHSKCCMWRTYVQDRVESCTSDASLPPELPCVSSTSESLYRLHAWQLRCFLFCFIFCSPRHRLVASGACTWHRQVLAGITTMRGCRGFWRIVNLIAADATPQHGQAERSVLSNFHRPSWASAAGNRQPAARCFMLAGAAAPQREPTPPVVDPFQLVQSELGCLSSRIKEAVASEIPVMQQAATYFFQGGKGEGKRIRSTLCLLVSSALSPAQPPADQTTTADLRPVSTVPVETRRRQQRIAEIAELIHVASLLHDDVIDDAETRRGKAALNHVLGNKVAILAGDFLLARASMTLASLENCDVVTLMSRILEDLVSGEVLQATAAPAALTSMEHYLRKTYLKTASLMANSCEAAAVVSGVGGRGRAAAHDFGKNLGLAFQARARAEFPHWQLLP
jgi:geranylgeranyl pyrophosphate synthase